MQWNWIVKALWTGLVSSPCCLRTLLRLPRAPITVHERFAMMPTSALPLRAPVTLHFDQHQIPFIVAEDDGDAAFALGLVHAHLRLAQMEVLRRIARGRVAEMLGPLAIPLDETLRTIDLARAAPRIAAQLPADTRNWMQAFVDGVNLYACRAQKLPLEFAALGLNREAWTIQDLIAVGHLAGSDINWLIGAELLRYRGRRDWSKIWARLIPDTDAYRRDRHLMTSVLRDCSRSGSNCLAVAASKTRRKSAILAGDPHVGLLLPNTWLIAGVRSPSLHAVGLMIPGLPVFMLGRTERIAWGGTYLRAASSDFVDISRLGRGEIHGRREHLKVRWWRSVDMTIRETRWGPIVSDCPLYRGSGQSFALRWMGHDESDEFSALLGAARARTFEDFRAAFRSYAISGQTFLYADVDGNVGRVTAARLPARDAAGPQDLLSSPDEVSEAWSRTVNAEALPAEFNVEAGYIVSANDEPQSHAVIGYFFSPPDRVERMVELLDRAEAIDLEQIFALQRDVRARSSMALRDILVANAHETKLAAQITSAAQSALEVISAWDGDYAEHSKGALAFEICRAALVAKLCETPLVGSDWAAFASIAAVEDWIRDSIAQASASQLKRALATGLEAAAQALFSFRDWGGVHRLRLSHPFGLVPLIGRPFRYADLPTGGSSQSLFMTAHGQVRGRHNVLFGSNARHVFDLSDPDENYFVLLGGQDGWLGSTTFSDQVRLWRAGRTVKVPLRLKAVQRNAAVSIELTP